MLFCFEPSRVLSVVPGNQPTDQAPACAAPLSDLRAPRVVAPPLACDSHLHILGPASRHPYTAERVYTPPDCLLPDYLALHRSLGLARCVLVQPSVYGSDNRVLLQALESLGDVTRGVVVLDEQTSSAQLRDMHALGVRGVRLNVVDVLSPEGGLPIEMLLRLEDRVAPMGWHLELLAHVDLYPNLDDDLARLHLPVVFGHMGYLTRGVSPQHPGMRAMLRLMQSGRAWAKISGPYRVSLQGAPYEPVADIVRWLVEGCAQQLVWGSDWPHVMAKGVMPHDADLFDLLGEWVPEAQRRESILVTNPARLYGWI